MRSPFRDGDGSEDESDPYKRNVGKKPNGSLLEPVKFGLFGMKTEFFPGVLKGPNKEAFGLRGSSPTVVTADAVAKSKESGND